MKLLILSDSHHNKRNLDMLVPIIKKDIDLVIHAGDNFKDSVYLGNNTGKDVVAVCGNCDWDNVEEEVVFDVEDITIFLTHGHNYGVKYDLTELARVASENSANIAIFGHTHIKEYKVIDGIEIINPGSLSLPRDGRDYSYIIMDVSGDKYTYEYILF